MTDRFSINNLIKKYSDKGYIFISASKENYDNLLKDIQDEKYLYVKIKGIFQNLENNLIEENAFIIVNSKLDFQNLEKFGHELSEKYNQEKILIIKIEEKQVNLDESLHQVPR